MDKRNSENFIMLPTVDFCFKELMQNPKVRPRIYCGDHGKRSEGDKKDNTHSEYYKERIKRCKAGDS